MTCTKERPLITRKHSSLKFYFDIIKGLIYTFDSKNYNKPAINYCAWYKTWHSYWPHFLFTFKVWTAFMLTNNQSLLLHRIENHLFNNESFYGYCVSYVDVEVHHSISFELGKNINLSTWLIEVIASIKALI